MKLIFIVSTIALLFSCVLIQKVWAHSLVIQRISPAYAKQMIGTTWHPGCPVPLTDLRIVRVVYWNFENKTQVGELIVHQAVAAEVQQIFQEIYQIHFPIQSIKTMEHFQGDDNASMAVNNSSAFNCRPNVTHPDQFSLHSYGRAIDINTLINPYIKQDKVLPPEGRAHLSRTLPEKGKITHGDPVYQIFAKYGWEWGGDWLDRQDYQHFQKAR